MEAPTRPSARPTAVRYLLATVVALGILLVFTFVTFGLRPPSEQTLTFTTTTTVTSTAISTTTVTHSATSSVQPVLLQEGQREGPLLVQKIFSDRVEGLHFREYPVAVPDGVPITLRIAESASNGCNVVLTLIGITASGALFLKEVKQTDVCPICLSEETLIDTPNGYVPVKDLRKDMPIWTTDLTGARQPAVVLQTTRTPVPTGFKAVHLVLEDGREVLASAGHPLPDGRTLGDIAYGDVFAGTRVKTAELKPYHAAFTYDILPSGETALYWANGVLLKSSLAKRDLNQVIAENSGS